MVDQTISFDTEWMFLLFLLLVTDGGKIPFDKGVKDFEAFNHQTVEEEKRRADFEEQVKSNCGRMEKEHDMGATIEFCRDNEKPCNMHCVRGLVEYYRRLSK